MSGRSSRSTLMLMKFSFINAAVASSSKDSCAITWHQWQAAYPTLSRIGLSSRRAWPSASSPQGCQSTGLFACCSKYGLVSPARRLAMRESGECDRGPKRRIPRQDGLSRAGPRRRLHSSTGARRAGSRPFSPQFVAPSSRHRSRKHSRAKLEPLPAAPPIPLYRRLPWLAVATTLLVILTAAFAEEPIRDAVALGNVSEAHLDLSVGYIAIAPISNVLDTLTLLGARQHIVVLISLVIACAAIRVWRWRQETRLAIADPVGRRPRLWREMGHAALFLLIVVLVYAAAAVVPRPMAAIVAEPSDVLLTVDFHSHTKYSHDGRPDWDPSDVRAWHRAAGFDVAYISDHRTAQGAELGIADNPAEAGRGTMLLQALEVGWRGEHVNVLNANRFYKGLTTPDLRDIDDQALTLASV